MGNKKSGIFNILGKKSANINNELMRDFGSKTYFHDLPQPAWMNRNYNKFADEAYTKNVITYKCISLVSKLSASVDWKLYERNGGDKKIISQHPVLDVLNYPNPMTNGSLFFESVISYKLISGNSFILAITGIDGTPKELYNLRPDRVSLTTDKQGYINNFIYDGGSREIKYPVDKITGRSSVLHIKNFHPLNDHFGLSPIEAAAYSIDQHNSAAKWNQSILQNGAKPSGAIIVKSANGGTSSLSEDQFNKLKQQLEEQYSGFNNAGRPMLLEGGLDWKEMSMSHKDMDFMECKNMAAREIALAFGVPPFLLGIPGDNTYSNLAEAHDALWDHTILPMLDDICDALNRWLMPMFKNSENLFISFDEDNISALNKRN